MGWKGWRLAKRGDGSWALAGLIFVIKKTYQERSKCKASSYTNLFLMPLQYEKQRLYYCFRYINVKDLLIYNT